MRPHAADPALTCGHHDGEGHEADGPRQGGFCISCIGQHQVAQLPSRLPASHRDCGTRRVCALRIDVGRTRSSSCATTFCLIQDMQKPPLCVSCGMDGRPMLQCASRGGWGLGTVSTSAPTNDRAIMTLETGPYRVKGGSAYSGQDFDGGKHTLAMPSAVHLHMIDQWLLRDGMLSPCFYPSPMRPEYALQHLTRCAGKGSYTLLMMRALTSLRAAASGETIGW